MSETAQHKPPKAPAMTEQVVALDVKDDGHFHEGTYSEAMVEGRKLKTPVAACTQKIAHSLLFPRAAFLRQVRAVAALPPADKEFASKACPKCVDLAVPDYDEQAKARGLPADRFDVDPNRGQRDGVDGQPEPAKPLPWRLVVEYPATQRLGWRDAIMQAAGRGPMFSKTNEGHPRTEAITWGFDSEALALRVKQQIEATGFKLSRCVVHHVDAQPA